MTSEDSTTPSIVAGALFAGRYILTERIAAGGMGEVWRADDTVLGRGVAVKFLREEFADDEMFRERLRREARAAGSISHVGVVPVFDFGEFTRDNGAHLAFIVMEYVDGPSLATLLKDGALSPARTMEIIEHTALALQAAHDAGVVHRDIKPANILIAPSGEVKLTDFGISHAADAMPITRTGTLVGTASYLSPEQASGQQATKPSDIYSLGVVSYACLTGDVPFAEGNDISIALSHIRDRPAEMPYDVPGGLRDLVMSMLEKDPDRRPPSAAAVAATIRTLRPSGAADHLDRPTMVAEAVAGPSAHTRVDLTPAATPERRTPRARILVLAAVAALLIVLVIVWNQSKGVTVPNVTGVQQAVATKELDDAGLRFTVTSVDISGTKAGTVIKQSVPADQKVDDGSTVVLTVASGKVRVPSGLKGSTYAVAATSLMKLGLKPERITAVSAGTPGSVIAISPEGRVANGSTVKLTVAVAPTPAPTPPKGNKGKDKGKKGH